MSTSNPIEPGASHADYEVKFEFCPRCGADNFRQTCIGSISLPGTRPGRDPNKRTCMSCGCVWMAPEVLKPGKS